MKKNANDYLTVQVDFERPYFTMPDLSSSEGNPWFFVKKIAETIKSSGFRYEAEEVLKYIHPKSQIPFNEMFNHLTYYVDFSSSTQQVGEDEDYVYLKVKKQSLDNYDNNLKQPVIFKMNQLASLQDLVEQEEDLSITNCYGRLIAHYITHVDAMDYLLKENQQHEWFNLFHLDNMMGTLLHTQQNLETFTVVLKAMAEENKELTARYLSGTNALGFNAELNLLTILDNNFSVKNENNFNHASFETLKDLMFVLKDVDNDLYGRIFSAFKNSDVIAKIFKQAPQELLFHVLDMSVTKKEDSLDDINFRKIKI
jgi:hypothetical protein